jgi:cyclophilin family peptidyl-prolyl cis-trans isomerase
MSTESNLADEAFRYAAKALDVDGRDRYAWDAFIQAAYTLDRFGEAAARLDEVFGDHKPAWAETLWKDTVAWRTRWQAEQKQRRAEAKANDLPRVRLIIEHRRFARDARGVALTTVESTGRGEVIVELFEDQAPATVANFLNLVSQNFYDGTRFHAAEPANLVAGGDPNSKGADPLKDGGGGPGYVIPDEFDRADARGHFRGALGMGNNARPGTAGSQFYITFAPNKEMDGHFTVFGRVIEGQEVIDRITLGRTNPRVGRFGNIVPGDLLVRAEIVRKRPHEYKVIKAPPR